MISIVFPVSWNILLFCTHKNFKEGRSGLPYSPEREMHHGI